MFRSNLHDSKTKAFKFLRNGFVLAMAAGILGAASDAQSGRFNIQQVGDVLTSYGKNTVNDNGNTYYTVQCGHDSWKSSVMVSLSPSGNVIWLTIDLVQLPSRLSTNAMSNLLKKNTDLGPVFFSIGGNSLRISSPLPNSDMSEKKLKAYLEQLVNLAVDNHDLWDTKTLEGTSKLSALTHPGPTLALVQNAFRRPKPQVEQQPQQQAQQ